MNFYLYQKQVEGHYHDLQHEAEQARILASIQHSRRRVLQFMVSKLGGLLVTWGTRLQQVGQYREQVMCNV